MFTTATDHFQSRASIDRASLEQPQDSVVYQPPQNYPEPDPRSSRLESQLTLAAVPTQIAMQREPAMFLREQAPQTFPRDHCGVPTPLATNDCAHRQTYDSRD